MEQLEKAISSHHINDIVAFSHSISGILASMQFFSVSKLRKMLESAARSNEMDEIELPYQNLKKKMQQIHYLIQSKYLIELCPSGKPA